MAAKSPLILLRGQLAKHAKAQTHTGAGVVSGLAIRPVSSFFQNKDEMSKFKHVSRLFAVAWQRVKEARVSRHARVND